MEDLIDGGFAERRVLVGKAAVLGGHGLVGRFAAMCPDLDPFEAVEQRAVDLSWGAVFFEVDLQLRKRTLAFADAGVAAEADLKAVNRDVAPAVSIAERAADCIAILGPRVLKQVVERRRQRQRDQLVAREQSVVGVQGGCASRDRR